MTKSVDDLPREEVSEQDIIEGCREMADVYFEIQSEFDALDTEVTCAFYPAE